MPNYYGLKNAKLSAAAAVAELRRRGYVKIFCAPEELAEMKSLLDTLTVSYEAVQCANGRDTLLKCNGLSESERAAQSSASFAAFRAAAGL